MSLFCIWANITKLQVVVFVQRVVQTATITDLSLIKLLSGDNGLQIFIIIFQWATKDILDASCHGKYSNPDTCGEGVPETPPWQTRDIDPMWV